MMSSTGASRVKHKFQVIKILPLFVFSVFVTRVWVSNSYFSYLMVFSKVPIPLMETVTVSP